MLHSVARDSAMNLKRVRQLLAQGKGSCALLIMLLSRQERTLVGEDLENAVAKGELLEDYGSRALLLNFTEEDRLPCHVVLEYVPGTKEVVIVTAYIPDAKEWEPNWKRRRRARRR